MRLEPVFARYVIVGGAIGLAATWALGALEDRLINGKLSYALCVTLIYAFGVVANYFLQSRITFPSAKQIDKRRFYRFSLVALFGSILTVGLAYAMRYHLYWPDPYRPTAGAISFAIACVLSSLVTFNLNRRWVF